MKKTNDNNSKKVKAWRLTAIISLTFNVLVAIMLTIGLVGSKKDYKGASATYDSANDVVEFTNNSTDLTRLGGWFKQLQGYQTNNRYTIQLASGSYYNYYGNQYNSSSIYYVRNSGNAYLQTMPTLVTWTFSDDAEYGISNTTIEQGANYTPWCIRFNSSSFSDWTAFKVYMGYVDYQYVSIEAYQINTMQFPNTYNLLTDNYDDVELVYMYGLTMQQVYLYDVQVDGAYIRYNYGTDYIYLNGENGRKNGRALPYAIGLYDGESNAYINALDKLYFRTLNYSLYDLLVEAINTDIDNQGTLFARFIFSDKPNYNSYYQGSYDSPLVTDEYFTTDTHLTEFLYYDIYQGDFMCGVENYNVVRIYFFNAYHNYFRVNGKVTYVDVQGFAYFKYMEYLNTYTNNSVVVLERQKGAESYGENEQLVECVLNSATWTNNKYKEIVMLSNANYDKLTAFNNFYGLYTGYYINEDVGLGNVFELLAHAFKCFSSLFAISIVPNITLGLLFFMPLIATIIVLIIRIVKR